MTYILLIVMYTGQVSMVEYPSKSACEQTLLNNWDNGTYKKIKTLECVLKS